MNDKTEPALTDVLRLAAKSATPYSTAMIGASHLSDAADTIDNLRAQLAEVEKQRDYAIHQAQIWKLEAASQKALRAAIDAAKGADNGAR